MLSANAELAAVIVSTAATSRHTSGVLTIRGFMSHAGAPGEKRSCLFQCEKRTHLRGLIGGNIQKRDERGSRLFHRGLPEADFQNFISVSSKDSGVSSS